MIAANEAIVRHEGAIIGKYLIGHVPGEAILSRYVAAAAKLLSEPSNVQDKAIIDFIRSRPEFLPSLDAVSAFLSPKGYLRSKILLMTALIEATPEYCERFFPRRFSKSYFVTEVLLLGIGSVIHVFIGALVLAWLKIKPA